MSERELIALRMPTGPTMVEAIERVWDDGDAILPLDPQLPSATVEQLLRSLRPAAIAHSRDGDGPAASLRTLPDARPVAAGVAAVVPTSGTTGEPKGVELTHAALHASVQASLARLGCTPGDRWLLCLPLHHVAGLLVLLRARALGTDPVVHRRFDPAAVTGAGPDFVSLVPTMLHRLLEAGADLAALGTILLGGAPATERLLARARDAGATVVTSYGMTETCGGCIYDGRPLDGVEVELTGDGRIAIRGPVLMRGYRGRPDLTARALHEGWLITPDLGRFDEEGRLVVRGRADDVILTGGENVAAAAVAAVVATCPGVGEAAVVGRADPEWGEVVVAVVVPVEGDAVPSLEDVRDHARAELPPHALPRELLVVDELPRTELGKADRVALRSLVGDG